MSVLLSMEGAVAQGLLWGLMALGVYLTFRILNVADMTVDGSFACGGAVTAALIASGMNPWLTFFFVFIAGLLAGLVTGLMNTKLKINILLASILTQLALYSINLRIMGRPNVGIEKKNSIVSDILFVFKKVVPGNAVRQNLQILCFGVLVVALIIAVLYWFFGTEFGSAIRATGNNEHMVRALGVSTDTTKLAGLMISNGLVAMSGALVAQTQLYADVNMGAGTIVIGLASIIIGEVFFGNHFGFWWVLMSAVAGSVLYRIVIAFVLQLGLKASDMKLLTAIVVAIALSVPVMKRRLIRLRNSLPGATLRDEENTRHVQLKKHDGEQ